MTPRALTVCAFVLASAGAVRAQEVLPPAPLVFFDIAGPNLPAQRTFYERVLGWKPGPVVGQASNVTVPAPAPVLGGTLRADAADAVLYFGVSDVTAALARVEANGGRIHAPRFAVPGVVILGLFRDPAGNLLGFVETKDGKAIVP
jgi:predicted enzyme related to lactoylglutathione lyase